MTPPTDPLIKAATLKGSSAAWFLWCQASSVVMAWQGHWWLAGGMLALSVLMGREWLRARREPEAARGGDDTPTIAEP